MAGRGHGFVPQTPDLFTPFCRIDRRERTSYFKVPEELARVDVDIKEDAKEDAQEDARRYYSPDFIGSALGGLSPPGTPDESPEKSEPKKQPQYFEYTARCGTVRNRTFPAGFSPPDITPISPHTKRAGFVLDAFSTQQPSPPPPAPQTPALGANPVRPPRIRRQVAAASSGHWDSDAVLMSQPDMTTPDETTSEEPISYMYPYSPSRSTRASTATTTSLATANTSATSNTATTNATVLSDATIKPRQSTSSIATSSTTTALPRTSITSFHRPLSSPHRNSTGNSTTANSPSSPSKPTPPVTPGKTANTALRRVRRESTRSEARSLPESTYTAGSTGSGGTSSSGPPKPRDWFRVRMDQIMADDVGGAAVGGIAQLPPPSPVPPAGGSSPSVGTAAGVAAATATGAVGSDHAPPRSLRSTHSNESTHSHSHNHPATQHQHRDGRAPAAAGASSTRPVAHTAASAGDVVGGPEFVWDVPEHLPGSPLCPLSPKHRGGGRGICVYHGRRKTQRTAEGSSSVDDGLDMIDGRGR
ncbi:uncharacterized protein J3D65DRAFT_619487 [Phyllosticta citribraziliensis]|uniref:Uncharacterized protein n=1 Tax=Phyllosticta citribraziliensis TaxID=989973 RepID=A0ABR1LWY7_9PEZI